jgi:ribonuclease J
VVDLVDGVARVTGKVECGYVFVDGASVGDITETALKDRRILGDEGFITVMVVVDASSGKLVAGPEIHARGFIEDDTVFDEVRPLVEEALRQALSDGYDDPYQLQQVVRRTMGRWVNQAHRRRPMIIPVVLEA